jgi:hypothetical protein
MAASVGLDVITYLADSVTTPVYDNPVGVIKDENVGLTKALADVTDRRSNGWRLQKPTLKDGTVTLTLIYDQGDADFSEFQTAFLNDTQVVLFLADGDATATGTWQGLLAAFEVSNFGQTRNLEDAVVVDAELVPNLDSADDAAPKWHSVTVT